MGLTNPDGSQAITPDEKQRASNIIERDQRNSEMDTYQKSLIAIMNDEIQRKAELEKQREQKRILATNNMSIIANELKRHGYQFKPGEFESLTNKAAA